MNVVRIEIRIWHENRAACTNRDNWTFFSLKVIKGCSTGLLFAKLTPVRLLTCAAFHREAIQGS
jgi:hypothetical protein